MRAPLSLRLHPKVQQHRLGDMAVVVSDFVDHAGGVSEAVKERLDHRPHEGVLVGRHQCHGWGPVHVPGREVVDDVGGRAGVAGELVEGNDGRSCRRGRRHVGERSG